MEEMKKQLYDLQDLTCQLDYINGLVYILREALRINEDVLNIHYTMASACISNMLMEFEETLDLLTEELFRSFAQISNAPKIFFSE